MEETLPKMIQRQAREHGDVPGQRSKNANGDFEPITFSQIYEKMLNFGGGLLVHGIKRGDKIGMLSDNRAEWLHADMGLLSIGAIDIPRGCDVTDDEISYILSFSECEILITENSTQLKRMIALRSKIPSLKKVILFDAADEGTVKEATAAKLEVINFPQIIEEGSNFRKDNPGKVEGELEKGRGDELATIIFTSGTTGNPKGVMLTHNNFIAQLDDLSWRIPLDLNSNAICILPVWHSFHRLCEYVILNAGCALCYSKPIGNILLADIQKVNPQVIPAVPRVVEAVYDGVLRAVRKKGGVTKVLFDFFVKVGIRFSRLDRKIFRKDPEFEKPSLGRFLLIFPWILLLPLKALGGVLVFKTIRQKFGNDMHCVVSGGGALPPQVDEFFWAVGVPVVEGYGLTETAPVVSVRPVPKPVFGTIGAPLNVLEVKIIDDDGKVLPPGKIGSVLVKGPTVMKGYYKREDLTAEVIDSDGWFDTGDLGTKTLHGELILRGRKKDTIVLRGGENIDPIAIEMAMIKSPYITQAVVCGQDEERLDQKFLVALIVPSKEEVQSYASKKGISATSFEELLKTQQIQQLFKDEISDLVNAKNGFKLFERINDFRLLEKPFEVGKELSIKQEVRRFKIPEFYTKELHEMYHNGEEK